MQHLPGHFQPHIARQRGDLIRMAPEHPHPNQLGGWAASRPVGWTRDQAVQYMLEHTAESRGSVEPEVDRYLAVPGQATAYLIGSLEIQRLRREAQTRLGRRFDIKGSTTPSSATARSPCRCCSERWSAGKRQPADPSFRQVPLTVGVPARMSPHTTPRYKALPLEDPDCPVQILSPSGNVRGTGVDARRVSETLHDSPCPEVFMLRLLLTVALLLPLLAPSVGAAQSYVTTTEHRVPFERVDSLRKLVKEDLPVVAEAKRSGGIVDNVWLMHRWAGEYSVVQVTTWKSWAAIEDTTMGLAAARRKVVPDSAARRKYNDRVNWVFEGVPHRDNIYVKME
jgi:hypothetical protein